jgi:hypothetical protein
MNMITLVRGAPVLGEVWSKGAAAAERKVLRSIMG